MRKDVLTDKKTSKIIKQPHFRQSTEEMAKKQNSCDHCTDKNSWKNNYVMEDQKKENFETSICNSFCWLFQIRYQL